MDSNTPPPYSPPSQTAGVTDVVTQLQNIVRQLTALVAAIKGRVTSGTITLTAGNTSVIAQPAVQGLSTISLTPTNVSATVSTLRPYVSSIAAGTSFTITTVGTAAGTETFSYTINTPT
jgi:hypothetical protein